MKELSIEEKAKRYDEAIERAKNYHSPEAVCNVRIAMENLFPELRESEDERMRKALIKFTRENQYMYTNYNGRKIIKEDMINWLENQDEQSVSRDDIVDNYFIKEIIEAAIYWGKEAPTENGIIPKDKLNHAIDYYCSELKKQCEQKPADKVEPKFKVGDWIITNKNHIWYVDEAPETTSYLYRLIHQYGKVEVVEFEIVDKKARLWTIQDAKDGDVLHSIGFHNDCIFIFNGLDNWKFDEPNGDRAVATGYCCLFVSADNMEFGIQGPDCVEVNTIKPATKIQRDLLFQKMKEAGYEWDVEKKELKKVEQNSTDEIGNYDHKKVLQTIINEQKPADETPYPETLEKAIDLYYYSYGNGKGEFEHLSLEKFRDIVHTFVNDYGQKS